MRRRVLSIFICMVILIGLLPTTAFANHIMEIDSVDILYLDYPIAGKELDTSYSVPTNGVYYTKDEEVSGVTWYDQGTSGIGTRGSGDVLESGAKAVNGHYYMAKIKLADVSYYKESTTTGGYFSDNVTVNYGDSCRLKKAETVRTNNTYQMYVYLYFKADYLYDGTYWIDLSADCVDDNFEVAAGTVPWDESVFYFYDPTHFDITTKWRKNGGFGNFMDENETFVAGEKYQLCVWLNSGVEGKNATFEDSDFFEISINGMPGEIQQIGTFCASANFIFTAKDAVDEVSIQGIQNPEPYVDMQTTGFTVGEGVKVSFLEWYKISGVEFPNEVTGKFQPNTEYRLALKLEPENGYTFNFAKEDISVNAGSIAKYSEGTGVVTIGIDFKVGAHTCEYGEEWEKDATNHWKACVCEETPQLGVHTYDDGVVTTVATCQKAGVKTYTCTVCGYTKTEEITVPHNYGATWEKDAANHWKACVCGEKVEVVAHTYDAGKVTKEATETEKGIKTYTCTVCGFTKTEDIPVIEKKAKELGEIIVDEAGASYKVTASNATNGTVAYSKPMNKKVKKVKVPDTVTIDGITYKVTSIQKNAFNGCTKLTSVTIGKNIITIGDKAFYKCTALKSITIPSKVNKIGKSAFEGCKKLKTIKIKTTKLTSKKVGNKAFKGTPSNAKITVPKKLLKAYKKFLYKKGINKKATIKK